MAELDVDPKADELMADDEDGESWSDDPVRMYLTQMGEIPLLTRQQEIALAKEIEITRARFRRKLLECDYVIQIAVKVLQARSRGELPFDRTVQVSVTDRLEKDQILGRFPHNLRTLEIAAEAEQGRLSHRAPASRTSMAQRREAWRRLGRRRRRAVQLVEELGLRTQRIEPHDQDARRIQPPGRRAEGRRSTQHKRSQAAAAERQAWLTEFRSILRATQETPTSLRNRVRYLQARLRRSISRPSAACRKATCGWSCRSPRSIATAA